MVLCRVGSINRLAQSLVTGLVHRYISTVVVLFIVTGVSALSFSCTIGVAVQSISVWGSSTIQALGSDSRRISTIII